MIDVQTLLFFRTVARSGSFLAASHELNYAQSGLSTRIGQLESSLNTTLFYRNRRGVTLTPKGQLFLEYADQVLRLLQEAESAVTDQGVANGPLSIGALETVTQIYLPELLSSYHVDNPDVHLVVHTGNSVDLTNAVLDRDLDAAFISGPVTHPDLIALQFQVETMLLACPLSCKAAPAGSGEQNTSSANARLTSFLRSNTLLAFSSGCYYRRLSEQFLQEQGIVPKHILEFDSIGGIIAGICAGLGISLLPASVLAIYEKSRHLTTYPVPAPYSSVPTWLIYRKDSCMTTAFSHFIAAIQTSPADSFLCT